MTNDNDSDSDNNKWERVPRMGPQIKAKGSQPQGGQNRGAQIMAIMAKGSYKGPKNDKNGKKAIFGLAIWNGQWNFC